MKKLHLSVLAAVALGLFSCSTEVEQDSFAEGIVKNAIYSSLTSRTSGVMKEAGFVYMVDFKFSPESLVSADAAEFNREYAKYAACMATDVYDSSEMVVTSGGISPASATDNISIYSNFGFTDAAEYKLNSDDYTSDKDDITNFVISHKNFTKDSTEYEVIMVTVQGSNATKEQWYSNFDIGNTTASYTTATGSHAEWTNTKYHKGFFIAAERADDKIQDYITANVSGTAKKIIFLTGHSRGGAIANILGAKYEKSTEFEKTFTYTFASPFTTTDKADAETYTTIFNFINDDDMITILPLQSWGFTRNGIIRNASISDSSELSSAWYLLLAYQREDLTGTYVSSGANNPEVVKSFQASAASRDELYVTGSTDDDLFALLMKDEQTANDKLAELNTLGIAKFGNLSVVSSDGKYYIKGYVSPAFVFSCIPAIIVSAENSSLLNGISSSEKYSPFAQQIISAAVSGGLAKAHDPSSYYVLADNL